MVPVNLYQAQVSHVFQLKVAMAKVVYLLLDIKICYDKEWRRFILEAI